MPGWYFSVRSLLALSTLVVGQRERQCDTYCPLYPMEKSLKKFRESVDGMYSGQEDAISAISRSLMKNMIENEPASGFGPWKDDTSAVAPTSTGPLLLHFTGPTGVGKTLMAQLLRDSLFVTECGVLKVHLDIGYKYASASGQRERVDSMKRQVVRQLERCPRSLIIFDDFQWAPELMILSLRDAFDESLASLSYREARVATQEAIFVFCSDLESEQRHLSESMSIDQARVKVAELARKQWKIVDDSSAFGRLFVGEGGMVPFVPLTEPELRKVIHIEIGKLTPRVERFLTFQADNTSVAHKWLGRVRWNEKRLDPVILRLLGEDLREYNARAIRNLIERHLLVHAAAIGTCLVRDSHRTEHPGWLWGATVNLLDDVKVVSVDPQQHAFTVHVGDEVCVATGGPPGGPPEGRPGGLGGHGTKREEL